MKPKKPDLLQGTLDLLVLKTLAHGPQHGYGVAQKILLLSRQILEVQHGSLYPALHRLERAKLLESYWTEHDGRKRKYYRLTAGGRKALAARRSEWQAFSAGVHGVLGLEMGVIGG